ncbi:AAA family ATPase [Fervidobacterium sp.]
MCIILKTKGGKIFTKVEKIILENFRAYKGRQEIEVEDFVALVGKNDQGKSTILEAIEIFF